MRIVQDAAEKNGWKPLRIFEEAYRLKGEKSVVAYRAFKRYKAENHIPAVVVDFCLDVLVPRKESKCSATSAA